MIKALCSSLASLLASPTATVMVSFPGFTLIDLIRWITRTKEYVDKLPA